jgi:hypothetical protein
MTAGLPCVRLLLDLRVQDRRQRDAESNQQDAQPDCDLDPPTGTAPV